MPQLRGIPFVWRAVDKLQPGDELLSTSGDQVIVTGKYDDDWGTWLDTSDGEAGYVEGRYRVIV